MKEILSMKKKTQGVPVQLSLSNMGRITRAGKENGSVSSV